MKAIHKLTIVGLALLGGLAGCSSQKDVPMLEGMDQKSAEAQIVELGFKIGRIENEFSAQKDPGKVLRQMPAAAAHAKKGTAIHLTLAESVTLPDLDGMEMEPAKAALTALGLRVKVEKQCLALGSTSGLVARQLPAAGERVAPRSLINIIVDEFVVVPPLIDETSGEARKRLQQAGLVAIKSTPEPSSKTPGTIIRQDPEAFQKVSKETVVNIYIADALAVTPVPDNPNQPPPPSVEPRKTDTDVLIDVAGGLIRTIVNGGDKKDKSKPTPPAQPGSTDGGSTGSGGAGSPGKNPIKPLKIKNPFDRINRFAK